MKRSHTHPIRFIKRKVSFKSHQTDIDGSSKEPKHNFNVT